MKLSLPDQMLYLAYYRIYLNIQIIVNEIKVEYIYIKKKKKIFPFYLCPPLLLFTVGDSGSIPNGSTNAKSAPKC